MYASTHPQRISLLLLHLKVASRFSPTWVPHATGFFTGTSSGISIWMETNRYSAVLVIRAPVTFPLKRGFPAMGTKLGEKMLISWPCFCCKPLPFFRQCKPYACRVASA